MRDTELHISVARLIAHTLGKPTPAIELGISHKTNSALVMKYEDEKVRILAAKDTLAMEIMKLDNHNPTTYVMDDGEVIRDHGEVTDLYQHLFAQLCVVLEKFRNNTVAITNAKMAWAEESRQRRASEKEKIIAGVKAGFDSK